jgi:hypothetical protein
MQSIAICGAIPHVWDASLDRVYHLCDPTSKETDLRPYICQPSVFPFIGYLQFAGFPLKLNMFVRYFCLLTYILSTRKRYLRIGLLIMARAYTFVYLLYYYHSYAIAAILSVPFFLDFLSSSRTARIRNAFLYGVWEYPILAAISGKYSFAFALLAVNNTIEKIFNEVQNWSTNRTSLIIHKQEGFMLPFGHFKLQDNQTGEQFEGLHTNINGFYEEFGWVCHGFKYFNGDSLEIPLPFSPFFFKRND